jgi:hypothetical protein
MANGEWRMENEWRMANGERNGEWRKVNGKDDKAWQGMARLQLWRYDKRRTNGKARHMHTFLNRFFYYLFPTFLLYCFHLYTNININTKTICMCPY